MKKKAAAILLALLLTPVAFPATTFADAIDEFMASYMQRHDVPGIALAITRDGQVLRAAGYGLANVEHKVPATPATVFQAGSVGKQFTAMAVIHVPRGGR